MSYIYVAGQIKPWSICSSLSQFEFFFCFCGKQKNILGTFDLLFILLLLFISTLLTSPIIPSLLCQHPSPHSFYLNTYLVSLEPQTFGFSFGFKSWCLTSEPWRLGSKFHYSFNYIYIVVVVVNFLKLFISDILTKENIPPIITLQYMYLCPNYI